MPAVSKHLKVLERAGLITRGREAQWRPCRIEPQALKDVDDWLERYRDFWEASLDRLDEYLDELQAKDAESRSRASATQAQTQAETAKPRRVHYHIREYRCDFDEEDYALPVVRQPHRGGGEVLHLGVRRKDPRHAAITATARPQPKGTVLTVTFTLQDEKFIALNGGPHFKFTEAVSFFVKCETQAEVDNYWTRSPRMAGRNRSAAGSRTNTACRGRSRRPCCSHASDRQGPGEGAARHAGDDDDEEDRHRGDRKSARRLSRHE